MIVAMVLAMATAAFGMNAYDRGVAAYNAGKKAEAQIALDEWAAAGGSEPQGFVLLGELAKGRGEHAKAGEWYAKAAASAKVGTKIRCAALRCHLYSLTKVWADAGIAAGDADAAVLEKEFGEDGDARVARATWWGRRQFELLKIGNAKDSIQYGEKSIAARGDFPLYGNNLAVAYCDVASGVSGADAKAWAKKALDLLARYKIEGKLAETKARAQAITDRVK